MQSLLSIPIALGLAAGGSHEAPAAEARPRALELYLTTPGGEDRLLRGDAAGALRDVTVEVGLAGNRDTRRALRADLDGDDDIDLLLLREDGTLRLFRNEGRAGFSEVTRASGLERIAGIRDAGLRDYDADGSPDLVLEREGAVPLLLHGLGDGTFERVELAPGAEVRHPRAAIAAPAPRGTAGAGAPPAPIESPTPDAARTRRPHGTARASADHLPGGPERQGAQPSRLPPEPPPSFMGGGCAETIEDLAGGYCLEVVSTGGVSELYPLSTDFNVDAAGNVGIGTATPVERLHVAGDVRVQDSARIMAGASSRLSLSGGDVTLSNSSGIVSGVLGAHPLVGGYLSLYDPGFPYVQLAGSFDQGGGGGLILAGAVETAFFCGEDLGGGSFLLRDDQGVARASFGQSANLPSFGVGHVSFRRAPFGPSGDVSLRTGGAVTSVSIGGLGSASNGAVGTAGYMSLRDQGTVSIELLGDTGYASPCGDNHAGCIELWDHNGSPYRSFFASARDSVGTGAEIVLRDSDGTATVDLDGQNGTTAQIALRETDGSLAFEMRGNTLRLFDSNGAVTQSYDRITGSKSAVIHTPSHGPRSVYMVEAPEIWLEDFGGTRLLDGEARVDLDPLFLETVTVDGEHPLDVQVTPTSASPGLWVEKDARGFTVREAPGGSGDARFDWRAMARRRGLEDRRLDPWIEPLDDPAQAVDPDAVAAVR